GGEMTAAGAEADPIRLAVVTGAHPYDVLGFHSLFSDLEGVVAYVQHMDDFTSSPDEVRGGYDVVLFYTMLMDTPKDEGVPWYQGTPRTALESLGQTEQGICILHHALLAYPDWGVWSRLVGIEDRTFGFHLDQSIRLEIANPVHPIIDGVQSWDMVDETYTMCGAGEDSEILLTAEHPKSMKTIAWTRRHGKSRVFCFQSGHDDTTWANADFRKVLGRGIRWCAQRI
ncbi:unnamed protein product, partial [marine sediment metagenome]